MYSFDFTDLEKLLKEENWKQVTTLLIEASRSLEAAGADFVIICSNTGHESADIIANNISIPLLHITDVTGEEIQHHKLDTVGIIGTKYTMSYSYIIDRLKNKFGLKIIIPNDDDMNLLNDIIYNELCAGIIRAESREIFKEIINKLIFAGAEGIILGCTEIPLLISQKDSSVLIFNTTEIHAKAAVEYALNG
jgi:aspartate racemase